MRYRLRRACAPRTLLGQCERRAEKGVRSSIFDENGEISRKALGAIVFSDSEKLKKLNGIVHPVVCSEALEIIAASGARLSVIDGSELEASGIDEKCRHIIVISARRDIRLSRIIKRDSIPAGTHSAASTRSAVLEKSNYR